MRRGPQQVGDLVRLRPTRVLHVPTNDVKFAVSEPLEPLTDTNRQVKMNREVQILQGLSNPRTAIGGMKMNEALKNVFWGR